MKTPPRHLAIAVAAARNGVIGRDGDLPWKIRSDLRRFKRLTWGATLIMGRRTWEEVGKPLPGRRLVVVSKRPLELPPGVVRAGDLGTALVAAGRGPTFCAGGARLYQEALGLARDLHLTRVEADVPGDVFFPAVNWSEWLLVYEERCQAGGGDEFATTYGWFRRVTR